jgi:hypothetical protein
MILDDQYEHIGRWLKIPLTVTFMLVDVDAGVTDIVQLA